MYYIRHVSKGTFWTGSRWQTKAYAKQYSPDQQAIVTLPVNGNWYAVAKDDPKPKTYKVDRYSRHRIYFALYYKKYRKPLEFFGMFDVWFRKDLHLALIEALDYYQFHRKRIDQFKMVDTYSELANKGSSGFTKDIVRNDERIIFVGLSEQEYGQLSEDMKNGKHKTSV